MSKLAFIAQAVDLYAMQGDTRANWLGPHHFNAAACYNWTLWGGVGNARADLAERVEVLGRDRIRNGKQERREMVRSFIAGFSDLDAAGSGEADDPAWKTPNQIFICSETSAPHDALINWSHWWIEIRNINTPNWTDACPPHLKLETVPGKPLAVRRGLETGDFVESSEYVLSVAVPVQDLSRQHFDTLADIHAARLLWRPDFIGEDRQEYLHESGLWESALAYQRKQGKARMVEAIDLPPDYVRPTMRGDEAAALRGGSCKLEGGTVIVV